MSLVPGWPSTVPLPTQTLPDAPASPTTIELLNELPFNKLPSVSNHTKTFTCFPNLPLEIRLAIWKLTFPPRILEITHRSTFGFYTHTPMPPSSHSNRESLTLSQTLYPLSFGSRMHDPHTRINFTIDTLYLPVPVSQYLEHFIDILSAREAAALRYLAIDSRALECEIVNMAACMRRVLRALKGLENLFVVYELPEMGRSRDCFEAACLRFVPHVPFEIIGSPRIRDLTREFARNEWEGLDRPSPSALATASPSAPTGLQTDQNADMSLPPEPPSTSPTDRVSRVVPVYGWRDCHCSNRESDSDWSERGRWTDINWTDSEDDEDEEDNGLGDWATYDPYGYGDAESDHHDGSDSYGPFGMDVVGYAAALMMGHEMLDGIYTDDDDDEDEDEDGEMGDSEVSEDDDDDDLPDVIPVDEL